MKLKIPKIMTRIFTKKQKDLWGDSIGAQVWGDLLSRKLLAEMRVHSAVGQLYDDPLKYYGALVHLDDDGHAIIKMIPYNKAYAEEPGKVEVKNPPDIETKEYHSTISHNGRCDCDACTPPAKAKICTGRVPTSQEQR